MTAVLWGEGEGQGHRLFLPILPAEGQGPGRAGQGRACLERNAGCGWDTSMSRAVALGQRPGASAPRDSSGSRAGDKAHGCAEAALWKG